jgi:hypothetical protein
MNSVIDPLFLRRLRIEYDSPTICLNDFAITSSFISGSAAPIIILEPIIPLGIPGPLTLTGLCANFLTWPVFPGQLCASVYFAPGMFNVGGPFSGVLECLSSGTIAVCSTGYFYFTANTPTGESAPTPPVLVNSPSGYTILTIPPIAGALCYNLYRNPDVTNINGTYVKYVSCFTGNLVEACAVGCYRVTAITPDGETPLSEPVCVHPDCGGQLSPVCPPGYIWNGLDCQNCVPQSCPSGQHWDAILCECVNNYGNDQQSGSLHCPTNPAIVVSGTIPAFTYTSSNPADYPGQLNALAQQALTSLLWFELQQAGCCPGGLSVSGTVVTNNTTCGFFIHTGVPGYDLASVPAGSATDIDLQIWNNTGNHLTPGIYNMPYAGFTGPGITIIKP